MRHLKKLWGDNDYKEIRIIFLFLFLFTILSCATNNNRKNIISKLYENNGNVFYITSTYVNKKIVWSYVNDKIIIYTLSSKNKILNKKEELVEKPMDLFNFNLNDNFEMDKCMELDGDLLGYQIKQNGVTESKEYPVNVKCFINTNYEAIFYNKLKDDIIKYNMLLYK
jgi:hypothetical protein